jgi:hypothetical protein
MRLLILSLAVGLAWLYLISRNRKLEFEIEAKIEPKHRNETGMAVAEEVEEH